MEGRAIVPTSSLLESRWMAWVPGGPDKPRTAGQVQGTSPEADQSAERGLEEPTLAGGRLLSAISTGFVKLLRDHYGRGPIKAKTYALDDIVVCVMRGSGFTPLEQTMMDSGDGRRIVEMREEFQGMMAKRYTHMIEELTDRKVLAFLSQAHIEPDITIEIFFVDRPLEGFGAVEVLDPGRPPRELDSRSGEVEA
jgi:uncharacterized protein YbcI